MAYSIEVVADLQNKCGEAPTWDPRGNRVVWTDNETENTYQYSLVTGKAEVLSQGITVGGIALNKPGGFVFAGFGGLHVWRGPGDYRTVATEFEGERLQFNDMLADPAGRVYAGTLYWGTDGMEKHGKLYLFSPDGSGRVVQDGVELSNGLSFSPDNRTLYYADSSARKIYAYEVNAATGDLSNRRTAVDVPREDGIPDGITVDAAGFIWCAMWYGSQIVRYDPQGKIERRIRMPVQQVSSLTFAGPDLTDLYVTSAGSSWKGDYAPIGYNFDAPNIGGPLYRIRTEIQGKLDPAANFA